MAPISRDMVSATQFCAARAYPLGVPSADVRALDQQKQANIVLQAMVWCAIFHSAIFAVFRARTTNARYQFSRQAKDSGKNSSKGGRQSWSPFLSHSDVHVVMRYVMASTNKVTPFPLNLSGYTFLVCVFASFPGGGPKGAGTVQPAPHSLSSVGITPLFQSLWHLGAIRGGRISSLGKLAHTRGHPTAELSTPSQAPLASLWRYIQALRRVSVQLVNQHGRRRLLHPRCRRSCGLVEVCVLQATTMVTPSLPARSRTPRSTKNPSSR